MPRFHTLVLPAALLANLLANLLAACQSRPAATVAGTAVHPGAHAEAPLPCNAAPVQHLIGHKATGDTVSRAVKASGATSHRVLAPDTPATLDFSPYRLNILTDADGIIRALRCE